MKERLTSGESFMASCSKDPDFFHFCMNHIPMQVGDKTEIILEIDALAISNDSSRVFIGLTCVH